MTTNYKGAVPGDEDVIRSVRLPRSLHARVAALAESEHRTFTQQVRLALSEHVESRELPEAA